MAYLRLLGLNRAQKVSSPGSSPQWGLVDQETAQGWRTPAFATWPVARYNFPQSVEGLVEQRTQLVFLLLILAQAAHSVEEYATRLYEVFPPARL